MLPSSPDPTPRARAERMLIARIITAVGLALLLVVGAWSSSHGTADVHTTFCVAAGVSHPTGASTGASGAGEHRIEAAGISVLSSDAVLCLVAVLCGVALVLLFRRLCGGLGRALGGAAPRAGLPSRAGPRFLLPALTLTQLSISRT